MINRLLNKMRSNYIFDYIFVKKQVDYSESKIYCIGDSHVSVFSGLGSKDNPYMVPSWPHHIVVNYPFIPIRLGAVLAYNAIKHKNKIENIIKLKSLNFNKEKDYLLFSFGEIDIRVHILKQSKLQDKPITEIIQIVVSRYFEMISYFYNRGYNLIIYGPIASAKEEVVVDGYSSYGSCKERNKITEIFNESLSKTLKNYNIPFISIFYDMIDESYETNNSLLMDEIHLSVDFLFLIIKKLNKYKILKNTTT